MKNLFAAAFAALVAFSAVTAYAEKIDFAKVKCMVSGAAAKEAKTSEWKECNVYFCCDNCKGKAEKMSDDDKVANLFGEEAYGKAKFAKAAK